VNIETHNRYVSNKATYRKIQEASDRLCEEHSLSVISEKSGRRGKSYSEYQAEIYGTSWKTLLRRTIDAAIQSSNTFESFLDFMTKCGYEIKHGAHIAFRADGQERFTRTKTIGENYTEERIRERIAAPKRMEIIPHRVKPITEKVIDRSDPKIRSSTAYRHWATMHNLHASADTLNYLSSRFNNDLEAFERHYADLIALRASIKKKHDEETLGIASERKGISETIRRINESKARCSKEIAAINTEIVEMDRIRENLISNHGERFYKQNSKPRRREMSR
jgi:hypothetical protein